MQPKTLYTVAAVTEKTIKDKPAALQAFVTANIEAVRTMYTDKAKVMPILVKFTGYPEKIISDTYDFMVKNCIWDANTGLSAGARTISPPNLMTKVGNIKEGKTPKYEDVVDTEFAKEGDRESSASGRDRFARPRRSKATSCRDGRTPPGNGGVRCRRDKTENRQGTRKQTR